MSRQLGIVDASFIEDLRKEALENDK